MQKKHEEVALKIRHFLETYECGDLSYGRQIYKDLLLASSPLFATDGFQQRIDRWVTGTTDCQNVLPD